VIDLFQIGCLAVLAAAYPFALRRHSPATIGALVLAAWLGEQSCISLYHFYAYAPGWHLKIGDVPALVPLIWPLVILSSYDVVDALWPPRTPLKVAALVVIDASLMEVVAVAAGLWTWSEPGYLGVPLIGILGWGFFALGAAFAEDLAVTLLTTHALLLATWWGALRWVLRRDLGPRAVAGFAVIAAVLAVAVLRARPRAMPLATAIPRGIATLLFVGLLLYLGPARAPLAWAHFGLVAVPYLLAIRWK
jgi:hypothetical protein